MSWGDCSRQLLGWRAQQCDDLCQRRAHPADSAAAIPPGPCRPLLWGQSGDEHGRTVQQPHLPLAAASAGIFLPLCTHWADTSNCSLTMMPEVQPQGQDCKLLMRPGLPQQSLRGSDMYPTLVLAQSMLKKLTACREAQCASPASWLVSKAFFWT